MGGGCADISWMGMWEQGQEVLWDHPERGGECSKRMNHENNNRLKDRARSSVVQKGAGCKESAGSLRRRSSEGVWTSAPDASLWR